MNDMTCIEFRQRIGAEPASREPALNRHRLACRTCGEHARALEAGERRLAAALALPVPDGLAHRVVLRATAETAPRPQRWMVAAAAVAALAVGVTFGVRWGDPVAGHAPLATDIVAHLGHEPHALDPVAVPVAYARVREVLGRAGAEVSDAGDLGFVAYARSCPFRGHLVPHLVFQGVDGPVTVFVLRHERVTEPTPFTEGAWQGVLVPHGAGSLAIVGSDAPSVDAVRTRVSRNLSLSI